jgi:hypothetical protein
MFRHECLVAAALAVAFHKMLGMSGTILVDP